MKSPGISEPSNPSRVSRSSLRSQLHEKYRQLKVTNQQNTQPTPSNNHRLSKHSSAKYLLFILPSFGWLISRQLRLVEISQRTNQSNSWWLPLLVGGIFWWLPSPMGVNEQAWHLLAIFLATILGFITKPLPIGAVAIIALTVSVATNTLTIEQGLSGFSQKTAWLTVSSFLIARAIIKTGLGTRIAYLFMTIFGKNTLLLSYGLLITDIILSPVMPSGKVLKLPRPYF